MASVSDTLLQFLHISPEAFFFLDSDDRVTEINPAAQDLIGKPSSEVIGKSIFDVIRIDPQSDISMQSLFSGYDSSRSYYELPILTTKNERLWIRCSFTHIKIGSSHTNVIVARNIQEHKQVEQMRSDFISIASHELRTPLTVIAGYLSPLLDGKIGKLSEKQRHFVSQIAEDTHSLSSLVEDLLDVSRLDSGKFKLHKSPISLSDTLRRTIESLHDKAFARNIFILYSPPKKNFPPLLGDKAKIRQVITNILDNAIKYTSEGGKISVDLQITDSDFVLTITDSGYGIEQKDLPHIFERFYRADNKLLDRVTGAGLGLYISKSIVEMHEGSITVDSVLEKGTTFIIKLPRSLEFEEGIEEDKPEKFTTALHNAFLQFLHGRR